MPELPTVGTPDSRRNSRPSRHLKKTIGLWSSTGHVRYDQVSESSKLVKRGTSTLPTIAGTPDRRNFRLTSELPTNQLENNKNFIMAGHIPDTSGIARPAKHRLALLSLKTHMGWLEHL